MSQYCKLPFITDATDASSYKTEANRWLYHNFAPSLTPAELCIWHTAYQAWSQGKLVEEWLIANPATNETATLAFENTGFGIRILVTKLFQRMRKNSKLTGRS